ncbi:YrdB family protein [Glycomyces xiaoerkulensis]|uniref:YrdB family protein n=1 Tax=Glycomyces xiaoerkulensis TaxID=2038139 RepID=UPI0018E4C948|nr:YrdB family protein [Glycomyces xiaoerkulensis]
MGGEERAPQAPSWESYSGAMRAFVLGNELLAFALELAVFAFAAWWALSLDLGLGARLAIGVAAFLAIAAFWGAFAAPKAPVRLPVYGVLLVKAVVFGAGALALWAVGQPTAAAAFGVLVVANTGLVTAIRAGRSR